jgi:hypothetical protein
VHTLELEALAEAASMGARAETPALDALAIPAPAAPAAPAPAAVADPTKLWPLFVLGLSYVHQATSGFALPALLPMVSPDLHLTDFQVRRDWTICHVVRAGTKHQARKAGYRHAGLVSA